MVRLLLILLPLLSDTAATSVYLQGNYGAATMAIEGTSNVGFSIHAESVYDFAVKKSPHRLFGEAYYSWNQSQHNRFVENSDYELLYPYLTTDTVCGGLHKESYYFRGGYTLLPKDNGLTLSVALSYLATQAYRTVDPRPKNKVADLSVAAKIGYSYHQYAYSALVEVGRYKQNNDISFFSELGESMIYHMTYPGKDYARFSGSNKSAYYHGGHTAVGLQVEPNHSGLIGAATYQWLHISKELNMATMLPISNLQVHDVSILLGYRQSAYQVRLSADIRFKRGIQYIYGEAINNAYTLLSQSQNYDEQVVHTTLYGSYRLPLPIGQMLFQGAIYGDIKSNYDYPVTACFAELATDLTSSSLGGMTAIRYAFPVHKRIDFFLQPKAEYTHYFASQHFRYQLNLAIGIFF